MAIGDDGAAQTQLDRAYTAYRGAMTGWRAAADTGHTERTERAAERLLDARVGLYRSLLATGWRPPADVVVQLDLDVALVEAPEDVEALLAG